MSDYIHEYYQNPQNCYGDLAIARQAFGNKETTKAEYDQLEKTLMIMYLHCPESLASVVFSEIDEAARRRDFFEVWWAEQ